MLERHLREWGAQPDGVANGSQALAQLRARREANQPYHLIIADVETPGMGAGDPASALRREAGLATIPIVLLAPERHRVEPEAGTPGGRLTAILTKPVRTSTLHGALVRLMNLHRLGQRPGEAAA